MPSIGNWMGETAAADFSADSIIARDPVTLLLARGAADIAAQTVRIVPQSSGRSEEQYGRDGSQAGELRCLVIGTDTLDIVRGDRFKYREAVYEVETVDRTMNGKTQAQARGVQK